MIIVRLKISVQLAAVLLLLLCGGALLFAWTAPVSVLAPPRTHVGPTAPPQREGNRPDEHNASDQWDGVFARSFQKPLFDPPPAAPPAVVEKVVPPPSIEVVATMPEPDGGSAMIRDEKGNVSVVSVGGAVTGGGTSATLVNVHDDEVELRHEGQLVTVKLKKD